MEKKQDSPDGYSIGIWGRIWRKQEVDHVELGKPGLRLNLS